MNESTSQLPKGFRAPIGRVLIWRFGIAVVEKVLTSPGSNSLLAAAVPATPPAGVNGIG
jgi:hypothetical protein